MQANRKTHAIQMMCAYFKVSRSGFYAWQGRDPSSRQLRDEGLIEQVKRIHADSRGGYGSPCVQHALAQQGTAVSRGTVARVMCRARLQGRSARLYRRSRVGQTAFFTSIPITVRAIQPARINQVRAGDVTYLRVSGQWRDLAAVMDKFSRRIIGWSLSRNRDAALTLDAVNHALRNRKPESDLHFPSDRGIEYAAFAYRQKLLQRGIVQGMNRPGKMNDNAHMESFFHSMKTEELYGQTFTSDDDLHKALLSYFQFCNQQRLHSSIGYRSPAVFEKSLCS
ncbi:IS3 family transposase [Piscinibacter sp. SJAQ100]|uniref:IS3 family transposase n=1 Tax=Aquariibacter albus TaxID=2759899 RepID=A0A839HPY1_9BURK|nr:IS3 family transposase [Aquariibacter albus]